MHVLKFSWPSDRSGTITFHEMLAENAQNSAVTSSLIGVFSMKFSMKGFDNDCNDSVRLRRTKHLFLDAGRTLQFRNLPLEFFFFLNQQEMIRKCISETTEVSFL